MILNSNSFFRTKFIFSLLNVLAAWLSGRVLDIPLYAFAFGRLFYRLYKSSLKIWKFLTVRKERIDYAFNTLKKLDGGKQIDPCKPDNKLGQSHRNRSD